MREEHAMDRVRSDCWSRLAMIADPHSTEVGGLGLGGEWGRNEAWASITALLKEALLCNGPLYIYIYIV